MEKIFQYLKPEVIAQLSSMELRARLVVEGFITGLHRSPYHGFSVEFSEHRQYMPGDEIKHIDWKAYGKTQRYYVKQFEEETNLKAYLILDASRSMGYASSGRISKLTYASYVAAALAYLMMEQRDAVGLVVYAEAMKVYQMPRASRPHLRQLLGELQRVKPEGVTNTAPTLHQIAERIKRRGLVILLSDLFDDPASVLTALKHFRHRGNEVLVLQVLDPLERSFAFGGDAVFRDMETAEELVTQPWHVQQSYREAFNQYLSRLRNECRENRIDHVILDTSTPFDRALFEYLNTRKRMP